jgi:hypothetical protein
MGERSSICCVGARSTLHEQQTHQKLGRAASLAEMSKPESVRRPRTRRDDGLSRTRVDSGWR